MMQTPLEAETYAPVALEAGTDIPVPPARNTFARRSVGIVATALLAGAAVVSSRRQVSVAPVIGDSLIGESGLVCEHDGSTDCSASKCCSKQNMFCFEKDKYWAACRESCVKGHHYLDPEDHKTPWSCKPLGGPPPPCGKKVRLLSHHDKFLTAEQDGLVKADRDHGNDWEEFHVTCTGDGLVALKTFHNKFLKIHPWKEAIHADASAINDWEKFLWVTHIDNKISLQAHTGMWLRATDKHEVRADAPRVDDWEKFRIINEADFEHPEFGCKQCGKGFCETPNLVPRTGKQCCSCKADGSCGSTVDFTGIDNAKCSKAPTVDNIECAKDGSESCKQSQCCKKSSERCFEKDEHWAACRESCVPGSFHEHDHAEHKAPWSCKPLGGEGAPVGKKIWLQSFHKKYLSTELVGGHIKADRHHANDWEKFFVKDMGSGFVALKGHTGKFARVRPDAKEVLADAAEADKWETFQWVDNRDGTFSLQAHTGKWLRATDDGKVFADASAISDWEKFDISEVP